MKVIHFIFAVYLLLLAVYPCSDGDTCIDEKELGIAFVDVTNHNHSQSELDFCTPFCICSCCATHIQLSHVIDPNFVNLIHNTELVAIYQEKPTLEKADSIWQPPKLA